MIFFLFKKIKFSSHAHRSTNQKDNCFKYKSVPISQKSIKLIEPSKIPLGNFAYMNDLEKKNKFNVYIYNLKIRLYFYNNYKIIKSNKINIAENFFLLKSTKSSIAKLDKNLDFSKINIISLCKYLLFYFSFNLPNSWYLQPKILRYIKRLYFFETGYRCKSGLSNIVLKNVYSHALFNSILRIILLEKKLSKNLNGHLHPFLEKLKIILLKENCDQTNNNLEIIIWFFDSLVSSEFLKDNYIFLKEFESELVNFMEKELNSDQKNNKNKLKIFLINFFINDFFLFLQKKNNFKYLNYNKKIFNVKIKPHSFFLIPK